MAINNSVNRRPLPAGFDGTVQINSGGSFAASKVTYYEGGGQGNLEIWPSLNNVALNIYSDVSQTIRMLETTSGTGETRIISNNSGLSIQNNTSIVLRGITATGSLTLTPSTGNVAITGNVTALNLSGTNTGDQTITLTGDVTGSGTGSFSATIVGNSVTDAKIRQSAGLSLLGRSTNTTGNIADITASLDHQVLRRSGTSIGFGALNLSQSAAITGTLPIANGGTGSATQNFVDLSTNQTVAGVKTFSSTISGNISTASAWQTGRTLTIGSTGKSVNGSADVSWTLTEIGAASRTLTLTAGSGIQTIGDLTTDRTIAVDSTVVRTTGDQTIAGNKTFSGTISVPTPTSSTHSATKAYVDSNVYISDGIFSNLLIVPSITSGSLTVIIRQINGTDPTALNPVFGYIGATAINITSALSITLASGTNWFNLNNTHFRSTAGTPFEVDLFVYLVYNTATTPASTHLAISRIPYALAFSDFDTLTTSNYGRQHNGSSTPNATDLVRVVGRITVTMNSSSQFVAPTSFRTVSGRITETNFCNWTPTVTGESGVTFDGAGGRDGRYKIIGDQFNFSLNTFGNVSGSTPSLTATLPFTSSSGDFGGGASVTAGSGTRAGIFDVTGSTGNLNFRDPLASFTTGGIRGIRMSSFYRLIK